jgi:hypothetical protein
MASRLAADPHQRDRPVPSSLSHADAGDDATSTLLPAVTGSKPLTQRLRQRLWQKAGFAQLSLDGQPRLLIDFAQDHGVPVNTAMLARPLVWALGAGFGRIVLQELPADRFASLASGHVHQPLRPVLWQIAQHGGEWDDLDRRLLHHARIRLLRWPDFRLLAHQHDGFRLCSLLLKRPSTVDECRRMLELDSDTVQAFVRSAYLCGYAMVETPASAARAAPSPAAAHGGSMLARMWRSLRSTAS